MLIFIFALALLCLWKLRFSRFHRDYLGKEQTDSLKGIFAMLILLSHVRAHIPVEGTLDQIYNAIFIRLGQLTVAPFFFYSGYGILQGICSKPDYEKKFFKNRIVKFLIGYNISVVALGAIWFCLGHRYPLENYLLAWSGWKTIGGSLSSDGQWFVFVTLVLYLITFLGMVFLRRLRSKGEKVYYGGLIGGVFVLSGLLMLALFFIKGDEGNFWYNTLMAYPFGMLYAVFQPKLDRLMEKTWRWLLVIAAVAAGAGVILLLGVTDAVSYTVMGYLFMLMICLLTMRIRVVNPALKWLGGMSFGVYILQRPIMLLFEHFGLDEYKIVFTAVCIALTLGVAIAHRWGWDKLSGLILKKK